ncbi:DUF6279 family lipoprotein [Psychrosphaera saromensis]|uniref:Lipoprotein n=1 Tax=Psychrosphaera saromensis TaxID=716813 RepID=A0A2S7UXM1_9GAMM|nr:DUF6279 family lipoprotein [Psychrosphaera saromensis]PQJ54673.1 hypothetical protein BTO11_14130 [Psychrosphaera saromensis]
MSKNMIRANGQRKATVKLLALVLLTFCLTSCSTKLIYNYADWLIFWTVDDYVELNEAQENVLEIKIYELLKWHRQEELPYYTSLLKELRTIVVNKDDLALEPLYQKARGLWKRAALKVTPDIIDFLPSLSQQQKQELVKNIKDIQQERNQQWQEDQDQTWDEKFEDAEDKIENFIGDLTQEQKVTLQAMERKRPDILPLRIAGRKRWLDLFSKALFNQPEIDQLTLFALFTELSSHRSIEQQNISEQISQLRISELRYIIKSMTDKQQVYLLEKIDDMTTDFELLIAQDQIN